MTCALTPGALPALPPRRLHLIAPGSGSWRGRPVPRDAGARDFVCGQCFQPLRERIDPARLAGFVITCPGCGADNEP